MGVYRVRLQIVNRSELNEWLFKHSVVLDNTCEAIKEDPPLGACYEDGDPIERPINVGWRDIVTGEEIAVEYQRIP